MSQTNHNIHCSECGAAFRCGAAAGEKTCWCFALPQVLPVPQAGEKQGCLCPQCLENRIKETMLNSKQVEE